MGRNGINRDPDVREIQDSLNYIPLHEGGARPFLDVDGACGTNTIEAIQRFQLKHFGWSGADGLVEVGRQTIDKLNEVLAQTRPRDMSVAHRAILAARQIIFAANKHIDLAGPYVNQPTAPPGRIPGLSRESRMRLLNEHFSIDDSPNPNETFATVKYHFHLMKTLFERPGGLWGCYTFEPDPAGTRGSTNRTSRQGKRSSSPSSVGWFGLERRRSGFPKEDDRPVHRGDAIPVYL